MAGGLLCGARLFPPRARAVAPRRVCVGGGGVARPGRPARVARANGVRRFPPRAPAVARRRPREALAARQRVFRALRPAGPLRTSAAPRDASPNQSSASTTFASSRKVLGRRRGTGRGRRRDRPGGRREHAAEVSTPARPSAPMDSAQTFRPRFDPPSRRRRTTTKAPPRSSSSSSSSSSLVREREYRFACAADCASPRRRATPDTQYEALEVEVRDGDDGEASR